jgi:hypothetical protein
VRSGGVAPKDLREKFEQSRPITALRGPYSYLWRVALHLCSGSTAAVEFSLSGHDELVEDGDAEPADSTSGSVSHLVEGPSDVTVVVALFDRRERDLRGEDDATAPRTPEPARSTDFRL